MHRTERRLAIASRRWRREVPLSSSLTLSRAGRLETKVCGTLSVYASCYRNSLGRRFQDLTYGEGRNTHLEVGSSSRVPISLGQSLTVIAPERGRRLKDWFLPCGIQENALGSGLCPA